MSKNAWIIFTVVCVAVLAGLVYMSRQNQVTIGDDVDHGKFVAASEANGNIADHVKGPKDSKAVLIEYGDFQCPACGAAHPNLKTITEEFGDELTFIFRNNPITSIHPNAKVAAAAAEAAGLQGKYWEMHDTLYERQQQWSNASVDDRIALFVQYAETVDVENIDKFKNDMESDAVNRKINFDLALARKVPVQGTPTFVLNGEKVSNDISGSAVNGDGSKLRKAIEDALK